MSKRNRDRDGHIVKPPNMVLPHDPSSELARIERERQEYQKERDGKEDAYKESQLTVNRGQLDANRRISICTAVLALHISERAYVSTSAPKLDFGKHSVDVRLRNTGRLGAQGELKAYNLVFDVTADASGNVSINAVTECHVNQAKVAVVPGSEESGITMLFSQMSTLAIKASRQKILAFGTFTYNDGFPSHPPDVVRFCLESVYYTAFDEIALNGCNYAYYLSQPQLTACCEDDSVETDKKK